LQPITRADAYNAEAERHASPQALRRAYDLADSAFAVHVRRFPADYAALVWRPDCGPRRAAISGDAELLSAARATAAQAAKLDRPADAVSALAAGDTGVAAIDRALAVPGLP
jgi:hypothetical protein